MSKRAQLTLTLIIVGCIAAIVAGSVTLSNNMHTAEALPTNNLLVNGGAELGGYYQDGVPQLFVAKYWRAWWHETDTRPEYKIAEYAIDRHRIHSGTKAHQWFNNYATHTAGIWQRVDGLSVGRQLTLNGWVQAWSASHDNPRVSDGKYRLRVGIDPYGGTDPESLDIVWSETVQPYDQYFELTVSTIARSDRATVFVWGQAEWPMKHNNAYVDDLSLVQEGEPEPTPTPNPTSTPTVTPTPDPTTPTPVPTVTPLPPDLVDQIATETHKRIVKSLGEALILAGEFLLLEAAP